MKKKLTALLLTFAAATALGTFAACGEAHEHTWGEWQISVTPSAVQTGLITRTCTEDSAHKESAILPALNSVDYTVVETEATCTLDGGVYYTLNDGTYLINGEHIVISVLDGSRATGHNLTYVEAVAATCTTDGNTAYYHCDKCDGYFTDEAAANATTLADVTISATGHTLVHHAATSATCTATGNTEYWYCGDCGTYFSDEAGTTTTTLAAVTIAATGHTLDEATYSNGKWYETCSVCGDVSTTEVTDTAQYTLLAGDATSLAAAIATGTANIKLTADITLTASAFAGSTFTSSTEVTNAAIVIDVAGNTLTIGSSGTLYVVNGNSLTFTDSANTSGSASTDVGLYLNNTKTTDSSFVVNTQSTVTFQNIVVSSTGTTLSPRGDTAAINIVNSRIISTGNYVVGTNSATKDNYGIAITISGSYLEADYSTDDSCVVMINVEGTLAISDSTIVGQRQGVVVRAGTATMANTTVSCSVAASNLISNFTSRTTYTSKWSNGNEVAMGAVVVGDDTVRNETSAAYLADATLTMTGCTLSYNITNDTNGTYDYLEIGLYLMRSNVTTERDDYKTTVTIDSATTINGLVVNICKDNTYENMTATCTLTGYSGTVYTTYSEGWKTDSSD